MGIMAQEPALFDFSHPRAAEGWMAVNDGVMGGLSSGGMQATGEGTVVFTGDVSLKNNGGFSSTRSRPAQRDFRDSSGILIRVRGDGRRYKLNLWTDSYLGGISYRVPFQTSGDGWQTLRFPFSIFQPTFRGQVVPGAPELDPAKIASVGFLISDRQAGLFRLEIASIETY
jgi:monofunctional biosynthetic peptidoglycan transglycosylase